MSTVINLIGGPGCGKSTVAAGLFSTLKRTGTSCELVTEYVKDIVYDNNQMELQDQLLISAQQNHRLMRLHNKVDFIICDASLINGIVYNQYHKTVNPAMDEILKYCFNQYNNKTFLLPRPEVYSPQGRLQTRSQAQLIDELFIDTMKELDISYFDLRDKHVDAIVNLIALTVLN